MIVAERVVEILQPVQIDEQHGSHAVGLDALDRLVERLEDRHAVREPGQAVVTRIMGQPAERLSPLDRDAREARPVLEQRKLLGQRKARPRPVKASVPSTSPAADLIGIDQQ